MKHLMLEVYCDRNKKDKTVRCKNANYEIGIHCFGENCRCKYLSYTKCPDEIAYGNSEGLVETLDDFVGFGGDMYVEDELKLEQLMAEWKKICRKKIKESFDEYMVIKNRICN